MVREFHRLAVFLDMGRDLRARHDSPRHLELDERSLVLREARTESSAPDLGSSLQRRWRAAGPSL